jgi:preprotein translocase subunit SecE
MAKKERNKRAARQARQQERAQAEAQREAQAEAAASSATIAKAKAEAPAKAEKKANKKPGFFGRIGNYFKEVIREMHRVVWPSGRDLRMYTVSVVVLLLIFGFVIWMLDSGIVAALVAFDGLRG